MSVADKLLKRANGNLSESLGVRGRHSPTPSDAGRRIPKANPDEGRTRAREAGYMELERIVPDPNQPRTHFPEESNEQLAASITQRGMLLPLRVRWDEQLDKWVILSGERRYHAAKKAGLASVPCLFIDRDLTEAERLEEQLVENLLREDLQPTEKALAFQKLMQLHHWTATDLSDTLHISNASISRAIALLKLPKDVQRKVDTGDVPASAAYELTKLGTAKEQRTLAQLITEGTLTRDAATHTIKAKRGKHSPIARRHPTKHVITIDGKTSVTVSIDRKRVTPRDILAALEAASEQVRSSLNQKTQKAA